VDGKRVYGRVKKTPYFNDSYCYEAVTMADLYKELYNALSKKFGLASEKKISEDPLL
jgi:hypothetical protein